MMLDAQLERHEPGLTLVEVVIALGILSIGLTALAATFPMAFNTLHAARQSSTAIFLALQKLEEVKAFVVSENPAQGFANVTARAFPAEPYDTIPGYPRYRRQATIVNPLTAPANTKVVQVTVFYRPMTEAGLAPVEAAVSLSTLIASR